jgi:hypothetical protein
MATWTGDKQVIANMRGFGQRIEKAALAIAEYFAPILEAYAKENADWVDRTGNARQALHGEAVELGRGTVAIYLIGGMDYQKWLELRFAGRYAIILPTMEAHYAEVMKMLREVFS